MKSARELSIMVFANSPESGRILSMRMSRFSGYSSGASTTGQRSWGKSENTAYTLKYNDVFATIESRYLFGCGLPYADLRIWWTHLRTSTKCLEEGVDLLLSYSAGSLLAKEQMGEEQLQDLYSNVLEATFLVSSEIRVHVWPQEVWKFLLDELRGWEAVEN